MKFLGILFTLIPIFLTGCSSIRKDIPGVRGGYITNEHGLKADSIFSGFKNAQGSNPMFASEIARKIFLINALDPKLPNNVNDDDEDSDPRKLANKQLYQLEVYLQNAYREFYKELNLKGEEYQKVRRNGIQSQLLALSDEQCSKFSTDLQQLQSDTGLLFGATTTLLGGLGAIFTPAATARALSGGAAITSGIGADYANNMFHQRTTTVITKGIEARRKRFRQERIEKMRKTKLSEYPVEDAIADAVEYHKNCTIIVGFSEAEEAVTKRSEQQDAGLKRMQKLAEKLGLTINFGKEPIGIDAAIEFPSLMSAWKQASDQAQQLKTETDKIRQKVGQQISALSTSDPLNKVLVTALNNAVVLLNQVDKEKDDIDSRPLNIESRNTITTDFHTIYSEWKDATTSEEKKFPESKLVIKLHETQFHLERAKQLVSQMRDKISAVKTLHKSVEEAVTLTITLTDANAEEGVKISEGEIDCNSSSRPCSIKFPMGATINLQTTVSQGRLSTWSGSCKEGEQKLITDKSCIATFSPKP